MTAIANRRGADMRTLQAMYGVFDEFEPKERRPKILKFFGLQPDAVDAQLAAVVREELENTLEAPPDVVEHCIAIVLEKAAVPKTKFDEADVVLLRYIINKFRVFPADERRQRVISFYGLSSGATVHQINAAIETDVESNFDLPADLAAKCVQLLHTNAFSHEMKLDCPDVQMMRWLKAWRNHSPANRRTRELSHFGPGNRLQLEHEVRDELLSLFDVPPKMVHHFVELILHRE